MFLKYFLLVLSIKLNILLLNSDLLIPFLFGIVISKILQASVLNRLLNTVYSFPFDIWVITDAYTGNLIIHFSSPQSVKVRLHIENVIWYWNSALRNQLIEILVANVMNFIVRFPFSFSDTRISACK